MDNDISNIAIISYGGALILLYLCILIYSQACKRQGNIHRNLITVVGVVPGLIGVIYGFSLMLKTENTAMGIGILTAWLLLEMGAIQLKRLIQKECSNA